MCFYSLKKNNTELYIAYFMPSLFVTLHFEAADRDAPLCYKMQKSGNGATLEFLGSFEGTSAMKTTKILENVLTFLVSQLKLIFGSDCSLLNIMQCLLKSNLL